MVSIIIATYNRAHLIEETLDSILNQTYLNWECLIIDDGSKDNTKEILQPYLLKDPRIKYYERAQGHKKGVPGCRNHGLELAKGDHIIFFDDDDIVHPDNLKICTKLLSHNELYFCRYDKEPFQGDRKPATVKPATAFTLKFVDINQIENVVMGKLPFASCTVLWKRECFEGHSFKEDLLYAEEWECYTRILSTGIKGISIDKVLYYNRKHPNSNTGEYFNNDPVRKASKIKAVKLIIKNLSKKGLLTPNLEHYFIQTAFFLKDFSIIDLTLKCSKGNFFTKLKYKIGYRFYPLIRPVFILKGKFKRMF